MSGNKISSTLLHETSSQPEREYQSLVGDTIHDHGTTHVALDMYHHVIIIHSHQLYRI
jgi:hypothetical protein